MDGVGTSIVGRPRRLSADRRARPTYTLIWEEPVSRTKVTWAGPELAPRIVRLNIDSRSGTIFIGATDQVSDVLTRACQAFGDRIHVFQAEQDVDILQSR